MQQRAAGHDTLLYVPALPELRCKLVYSILTDEHYAYLVASARGWQSIVAYSSLAENGIERVVLEQVRLEVLQHDAAHQCDG
jgi:hypothetical protein